MKKLASGLAVAALAAAISAPILAQDKGAMSSMPGMDAMAPMAASAAGNGMGADLRDMHMNGHMRMTEPRTATLEDIDSANDLLSTLRSALAPYRNYHAALAHGFRIFMPSVPQDVYHFTNYAWSGDEYRGRFNPAHPGSLLYVKQPDGNYVLVGAMYSAPPYFTPDDLNSLVPLGIARWHEHIDICLPAGITLDDLLRGNVGQGKRDLPGMIPVAANPEALGLDRKYGVFADGRFGFTGKIHDASACQAAGGNFLPLAFGWMVHVYPFAGDDLKVAFGTAVPKPPAQ
ncbi:MAG TPA: hypothetical protein VNF29_12305 [Candidatus Binataceae bacterium]|nr:hypothetical protein [Candidatus Binataceae bacterium]